ncbi:MAG TPA: FMN-binding protein [Solirubrobacteraceae bacterium]
MRRKLVASAVAVVVVVAVLVLVLHHQQKIQRSSTPVHVSSPGGTTSTPSGGSTPPTPATSKVSGVFTGPAVEMEYGPVQVAIDVQGGKITDVKAMQYPVDRPRSQFINSQAVPLLRSEVLQAQSANVNLISGATFTSEAFARSLQAAIEQEQKKVATH